MAKTRKKTTKTSKKTTMTGKQAVASILKHQWQTAFIKVYIEQYLTDTEREEYTKLKTSENKTRQVLNGMENYAKIARQRFREHIENADSSEYFVAGIDHDKDTKVDKNGKEELEDEHFHIIIWKLTDTPRFRVRRILALLGINFSDKDETLIRKGAVQQSPTANRPNLMMYLTHETPKAIEDGKHHYKLSEIVSNQPLQAILDVRKQFTGANKHVKLTDNQWDYLTQQAYNLGLNTGDFDAWADTFFTTKQQASAPFKVVEKHYYAGLQKKMGKNPKRIRCCVYIWGGHDLGKTYTANKALNNLNETVYVAGKGSGKYDGVTASTTAITFDDTPSSDALNVFDNYDRPLHRRNSGDRPWTGHYAIATNNADPATWMSQMLRLPYNSDEFHDGHYDNENDDDLFQALISRFYICHIENAHLVVDSIEDRGTMDDHRAHDKLFLKFANEFNKELLKYAKHTRISNAKLYPDIEEAGKQAEMIAKRLGYDWLSGELKNVYETWKQLQREKYAIKNHDNPYIEHSKAIDNTFLLTPSHPTKNEEGLEKMQARRLQLEINRHEQSAQLRIQKRLNVRKMKTVKIHKQAE